jgi:hypothetical protein
MPFTNGTFANVVGATSAAPLDIIQSAVWNAIHSDYSEALNMLMGQLITTPSNRNIAWMNGGFEVWQHGAGATSSIAVAASTVAYTADRWYIATDANQASTVSAQAGLVDESQLCARVQRNSGQTGVGDMYFAYPLDTDEIYRCRGNIANLSFRVRAGSNWSPASGTLNYRVYSGTGAAPAKRGGSAYTGGATAISGSVNLTTSATLVQASSAAIVPVGTTQMEIQFTWTPVGTAGTNDYFEVDDLQLELSLSPDEFTYTSYDRLDFPSMLAGCKRHYQKTFVYDIQPSAGTSELCTPLSGLSQAAVTAGAFWMFNPQLRANPTLNTFSALTATSSGYINNVNTVSYGLALSASSEIGVLIRTSTAVSAGAIFILHAAASAGI